MSGRLGGIDCHLCQQGWLWLSVIMAEFGFRSCQVEWLDFAKKSVLWLSVMSGRMARFYCQSCQIKMVVWLSVMSHRAAGFIVSPVR